MFSFNGQLPKLGLLTRMFAIPLLPQPPQMAARLLNALLKREDWARNRLSGYAGKTVCLMLGERRLSFSIAHDGYVQTSDAAIQADVLLSLPAEKLPGVLDLARQGNFSQLSALMHVQGEAGLASVVSELAANLRWDYEDDLAQLLGDTVAVRIVSGVRWLQRSVQQAGDNVLTNAGEFLAEEGDMMLSQNSFSVWKHELHQAEQRLQQLDARLARVKAGRS